MFQNIQGLKCSKARIVLVQQEVIPSNEYGKGPTGCWAFFMCDITSF